MTAFSSAEINPAITRRPLEGRTTIVTGSTSGIGLGIATSLASQGSAIVLNGLGDDEVVERSRSSLSADHDVEVAYDNADMSKPDMIARLVERAAKHFGRIDILVNNAGIQHVSPIEEFPIAKWDAIIAINLSAAFHLTRLVFGGMKERGWGRIVNIASAHGLIASPFKSAYVAAKHGMLGLTKTVALEGARSGVTCNAVCPGYVWTPLVEKQIDAQAKSHGISRERVIDEILLGNQPNKRFATVEEMGATVAFLCSEAAASITGVALPIDGGWTAQ